MRPAGRFSLAGQAAAAAAQQKSNTTVGRDRPSHPPDWPIPIIQRLVTVPAISRAAFRVSCNAEGTLSMNRLSAILPAANVLLDVDATSKKRAFEHAGVLFENQHAIARATVSDNLFARERLGSTGLGHGVAIPHGRIKGLKNPLAAVLRVRQPIAFDAPDDEPVSLLIFLLVPEAATQRHLDILSEIAEMLSDRALRERLMTETDAAVLHKLIADWEPLKSVA
jgi:PTS system nitrogen regulatory IIA component